MTMKLIKKVAISALALMMIVAGVVIAPEKIQAAASPGFELEVNVGDETDGMHVENIKVPEMIVRFRLVPEVTTLPADTRYNDQRGDFPAGNSPTDTKVIEFDYKIDAFMSDSSGKKPANSLIEIEDVAELKAGTAVWGVNSKVYRYHLNMVAIYRTDDAGMANTAVNYLNTGTLISAPTETELLLDIYVNAAGTVESTVLWDKTGSDKLLGFATSGPMGRAAGATGASGITYNVYDLEVSTDYIGLSSNSIAGKVMYSVVLDNVPMYLTNGQTNTDPIKHAIVHRNKDSWVNDLSQMNLSSNKVAFTGALADNDKIVFAGLPYEGADGNPISYSASIDYSKVTDLAGVDAKDKYKDSIYYGAHTERIDGSITTMDSFIATSYASSYDYSPGVGYIKSTATVLMDQGSSTSDNNARFIVFDPAELVIVGVTVNALPGVVAILAAVAGIAVFVVARRRRRVRY